MNSPLSDQANEQTAGKHITYVADPMCSWCWGFSPVIRALDEAVRGRASLSVVVGGLRPGTTEVMDPSMKDSIRHHWEQVNQASGQPFTFGLFDRDDFIYDTEPACRAVVAVRALAPDGALPMFEALHQAFYVDNDDITKTDILTRVAGSVGVDEAAFARAFASQDAVRRTVEDFQLSRSLGITGFPTVVVRDENGYAFLTVGYRPYEALEPLLESWLES
jgi:putative protein-disulfide isomerase